MPNKVEVAINKLAASATGQKDSIKLQFNYVDRRLHLIFEVAPQIVTPNEMQL